MNQTPQVEALPGMTPLGLKPAVDYSKMSISQLAGVVSKDWPKVNYAAKPYLDAMYSLENINDAYYQDSGKSVVLYFLCNASSWKGETAKAVKKELNRRAK